MADIFVSYKAEDRARVRPLVDALSADGFNVWWDAHIGAGDEWRETIASNLDTAKCVIVAWSKKSVGPDGRFVRDEAARAAKRGIYLPVTIDKVDPPLGFGETQCLPLSGWKGDRDDPRYLALLDKARRVVGGDKTSAPAQATSASHAAPAVGRRGVLVGGGVAALAAAGGVGWFFLKGSPANAASVAVLPFANLSGDPAQAYFSDGLAEELRAALSRIGGLKVIGRTSSELVRDEDTKEAASKLDVGTVVTGSVRRSPSTIRVSAQLIDGGTGVEKWSQTFDRPTGDVLQIQTSIAEAVATQLRSQLGAKDIAALTLGGTTNAAAQDLFLQADANVEITRDAFQSQIALYDAAIKLDPDYAAAYAGKAVAMSSVAGYFATGVDELNRGVQAAEAVARKAIDLAPEFPGGHSAMAFVLQTGNDYRGAWNEYQRALASPGILPRTQVSVVTFVSRMGNQERSATILRKAEDTDPLNPRIDLAKGVIASNSRRYGEAISAYRKYLEKFPNATGPRAGLVAALIYANQNPEAAVEVEKLPHDFPTWFVARSILAFRAGDRARAVSILNDMRRQVGDTGKYQYAEMLTVIGDHDDALAELEGAVRLRDAGLSLLPCDPLFDPLRDDPRFKALVAKLNYPVIS